uniref:Transport permease protein n=1 Tax=Streptomyces sp. NBC_00008 TaxID=2903610 RepID=A0AAU2W0G5_9ACTN
MERSLVVYRHSWHLLLAEIFEPVLYLLALGVGIGALVGEMPGLHPGGGGYAAFVAPALLATAAMNGAMDETTFNLYAKLRTLRTYDAVLSTPLSVRDIAFGEVLWALLRGTAITGVFAVALAAFGMVTSLWALLVLPGALLIGFAFASLGLAVVTFIRSWQDFQLVQLFMLPMFLFATTFYPLGVYPRPVQIVVECLPLYHSIQLIRLPATGVVDGSLAVAAVYLLALGALGLALALRRLRTALVR